MVNMFKIPLSSIRKYILHCMSTCNGTTLKQFLSCFKGTGGSQQFVNEAYSEFSNDLLNIDSDELIEYSSSC